MSGTLDMQVATPACCAREIGKATRAGAVSWCCSTCGTGWLLGDNNDPHRATKIKGGRPYDDERCYWGAAR